MTALETEAERASLFLEQMEVESIEGPLDMAEPRYGAGLVLPFQGKTAFYQIEAYDSGPKGFTEQPEYSALNEEIVELYLATYPYRDRDISVKRMKRGLSHPRSKLLVARHGDETKGFGLFPKFYFEGEPVIYSTRAFLVEGDGLGTFILDAGIQLHQADAIKGRNRIPRWGVLMTQSVYSILTLIKLKSEKHQKRLEELLPFDFRYDNKIHPDAPLAMKLWTQVENHVGLSSTELIKGTGVSRGELREIGENEVKKPERDKEPEAWQLFHQMYTDPTPDEPYNLGMRLHNGDVDFVTFRIRRPSSDVDRIFAQALNTSALIDVA